MIVLLMKMLGISGESSGLSGQTTRDAHEDHLAHKLGNLLRLTHQELIDTKIRARQPSS